MPLNSFPPEPAISAVDWTLPDVPSVRKPPGNPAARLGVAAPTPPLWAGERAEKRNQQERGTGPPAASGSLAECTHQTGNLSSGGQDTGPAQHPCREREGPNRDMNASLASYPAPGPHTLDLDMPVTGAYSGFPPSPSINSFHIISHSWYPGARMPTGVENVWQLCAGGEHWSAQWLRSGSEAKQYDSVCKLTTPPPPAYEGRGAKDAELGPLPSHPWRMLLPCKENCGLRYHSLLQIKAPLGVSLVAQR